VESSDEAGSLEVMPLSVVPTQDGAVVETYSEIVRLRSDALPIVDGDQAGREYIGKLCQLNSPPRQIVCLGDDAAIEALVAWILEPALSAPGPTLCTLLPDLNKRTLRALQRALSTNTDKKDRELRENLASEAMEEPMCVMRAAEFLGDLTAILSNSKPKNAGWRKQIRNGGVEVHVATHIRKD
jgi:hypothetical protein